METQETALAAPGERPSRTQRGEEAQAGKGHRPIVAYFSAVPIQIVATAQDPSSFFLLLVDGECRIVGRGPYAELSRRMENLRSAYERFFGLCFKKVPISTPAPPRLLRGDPPARMRLLRDCGRSFVTDGTEFFYRTNADAIRVEGLHDGERSVYASLAHDDPRPRPGDLFGGEPEAKHAHPIFNAPRESNPRPWPRSVPVRESNPSDDHVPLLGAPRCRGCGLPNCHRCYETYAKYPPQPPMAMTMAPRFAPWAAPPGGNGLASNHHRPERQEFVSRTRIEGTDLRRINPDGARFKRLPLIISPYVHPPRDTPGPVAVLGGSKAPKAPVPQQHQFKGGDVRQREPNPRDGPVAPSTYSTKPRAVTVAEEQSRAAYPPRQPRVPVPEKPPAEGPSAFDGYDDFDDRPEMPDIF